MDSFSGRLRTVMALGVGVAIGVLLAEIVPIVQRSGVVRADTVPIARNTPPALTEADRAAKIQETLSDQPRVRFDAVRALNTLGYSPESLQALLAVVCNKYEDITARVYAASGLDGYYRSMTEAEKALVREKLRALVLEEKGDTPDAVSRYLLKNGDAALIIEVVVPDSAIPPIPWTIFGEVSRHLSSEQLLEMYRALPHGRRDDLFRRRSDIGRELVSRNDPRGVDILIQLLRPENAPGPQHRHNVWAFLAPKIGQSFGYGSPNYSPEFEQVVPKILTWWKENKATFDFKPKPANGRFLE